METPISQLYYNYQNLSDEQIRSVLNRIQIVELKSDGNNVNIYPLTKKSIAKITKNPRTNALNFCETEDVSVTNLVEWKKIDYICKSSSRFILKVDIGEILDQIESTDLKTVNKFHAVGFNTIRQLLPATEGEHFKMTATLFTKI